jgi:hypothetical protein
MGIGKMNLEVPFDFVQPNFIGDIVLVIIICLAGIQTKMTPYAGWSPERFPFPTEKDGKCIVLRRQAVRAW